MLRPSGVGWCRQLAYDFRRFSVDVSVYFQEIGTLWPGILAKVDHPVHALFKAVEDDVAGVSCGCADVFGARDEAVKNGFDSI